MKRDPVLHDNPSLHQPQQEHHESGSHIVYNLEFREMQDRLYNRLHSSSIHHDDNDDDNDGHDGDEEEEGKDHETISSNRNRNSNRNSTNNKRHTREDGIEMTGDLLWKFIV